MMFVGDQGKILAGFHGEDPRIIPEEKMRQYRALKNLPETDARQRRQGRSYTPWATAFKNRQPTVGDFLLAGPISDAFNLGAVSLRMGGRRLFFDAATMKVVNVPEANNYLR